MWGPHGVETTETTGVGTWGPSGDDGDDRDDMRMTGTTWGQQNHEKCNNF